MFRTLTTGRTLTTLYLFTVMVWFAPFLRAQDKPVTKIKTSAIKVEMIQSDEIKLPAEFQVALYENLIQQMEKKSGLTHVCREGTGMEPTLPAW